MRLFTGLALPQEAGAALAMLARDLPKHVPEEKLHITTKFIGEWPEHRLNELQRVLGSVQSPPLSIDLCGLERWRSTVVAVVQASEALRALAEATEAVLEPLGVPREQRGFRPHVTLARAPAKQLPPLPGLRFTATGFCLYLSASGKYTKLNQFPFHPA